jgi:hypothetical protein
VTTKGVTMGWIKGMDEEGDRTVGKRGERRSRSAISFETERGEGRNEPNDVNRRRNNLEVSARRTTGVSFPVSATEKDGSVGLNVVGKEESARFGEIGRQRTGAIEEPAGEGGELRIVCSEARQEGEGRGDSGVRSKGEGKNERRKNRGQLVCRMEGEAAAHCLDRTFHPLQARPSLCFESDRKHDMVSQAFANAIHFEFLLDASRIERLLATDPGTEEELRSAVRALRDDDLLAGAGDVARSGRRLSEFDASDTTLSISISGGGENELGAGGAGEDAEVLAVVEDARRKIGGRSGGTLTFRVDVRFETSDLWRGEQG